VESEISDIRSLGSFDELDSSDLAGAVFSIEQQLTNLPKHAVLEELVAKLNQFKTYTIRKQLTEYRTALLSAEESGNDKELKKTLEKIKEYEVKLREPAYEADGFLVTRD
jgi:hypothetical protein